jgi:hypothetical protein
MSRAQEILTQQLQTLIGASVQLDDGRSRAVSILSVSVRNDGHCTARVRSVESDTEGKVLDLDEQDLHIGTLQTELEEWSEMHMQAVQAFRSELERRLHKEFSIINLWPKLSLIQMLEVWDRDGIAPKPPWRFKASTREIASKIAIDLEPISMIEARNLTQDGLGGVKIGDFSWVVAGLGADDCCLLLITEDKQVKIVCTDFEWYAPFDGDTVTIRSVCHSIAMAVEDLEVELRIPYSDADVELGDIDDNELESALEELEEYEYLLLGDFLRFGHGHTEWLDPRIQLDSTGYDFFQDGYTQELRKQKPEVAELFDRFIREHIEQEYIAVAHVQE